MREQPEGTLYIVASNMSRAHNMKYELKDVLDTFERVRLVVNSNQLKGVYLVPNDRVEFERVNDIYPALFKDYMRLLKELRYVIRMSKAILAYTPKTISLSEGTHQAGGALDLSLGALIHYASAIIDPNSTNILTNIGC